jgi:hypothetical protein
MIVRTNTIAVSTASSYGAMEESSPWGPVPAPAEEN